MDKPFLTIDDIKNRLNLSRNGVIRMCQSGQLPAYKIGAMWRIDPDDLDIWLASRRFHPKTPHDNDGHHETFVSNSEHTA